MNRLFLLLLLSVFGNFILRAETCPGPITGIDPPPVTLCAGECFDYASVQYCNDNQSGSAQFPITLLTPDGCDSLVTLTVNYTSPAISIQNILICDGDSYTVGSQTFNINGTYQVTITGTNGCDSIITLNLTVLPPIVTNLNFTICEGQSFTLGQYLLNTSGIYQDTTTAMNGCDSITVLNLTVLPALYTNLNVTICNGESYTVGTQTFNASGVYEVVLLSSVGCDSIVDLTLYVGPLSFISGPPSACAGDMTTVLITFWGTPPFILDYLEGSTPHTITTSETQYALVVSPASTTTYSLTSVMDAHCSSQLNSSYTLVVHASPTATLSVPNFTACEGNEVSLPVDFTGVPPYTLNFNINGVPYTIETSNNPYQLVIDPGPGITVVPSFVADQFCPGQVSGVTTVQTTAPATLDTTIILCEGETLSFNGDTYTQEGTYTTTIFGPPNQNCSDTIVTLHFITNDIGGTYLAPGVLTCSGNVVVLNASLVTGDGALTYAWYYNGILIGSSNMQTVQNPGDYQLVVTSTLVVNGVLSQCPESTIFTVMQDPGIAILSEFTDCIPDQSGYIVTLTVAGGQPPYFSSSPGVFNGNVFTSDTIPAGNPYNIEIFDASGCSHTASGFQPCNCTLAICSPTITNVSCSGGNDGAIGLCVTGGTPPYTYTWPFPGFDWQHLTAGTYSVTVSDIMGCVTSANFTITEPLPISILLTASCPGNQGDDGMITILAAGGVTPYLYSWSNGVNTATNVVTGLIAGTYTVTVTDVNGCTATNSIEVSSCVWPGDTDTSGTVNNYDLLNIGLAYNTSGPVRPLASLDWGGQASNNWPEQTPDGVNYKHSDTNGDGIIESNDTLAITLNWGLMHNLLGPGENNFGSNGQTDLFSTAPFYVQPDTLIPGAVMTLPVILGNSSNPAANVYGLAFSITYNPDFVVPGSAHLTFNDSWIGTLNSDMIAVQKDFHDNGRIDIGLTRINGSNTSGFGQIGELNITIEDDIFLRPHHGEIRSGQDTSALFNIIDELVINNNKEEIPIIPEQTSAVVVDTSTTATGWIPDALLQLFPNPAGERFYLSTPGCQIRQVLLYNTSGQVVSTFTPDADHLTIPVTSIPEGVYLLKVFTDKGMGGRKVVVLR